MFLFLCSRDSVAIHPSNRPSDFMIELNLPINLAGRWECALMDLDFESSPGMNRVFVCCDLVTESCVGDSALQVLRSLDVSTRSRVRASFAQPYYVPVRAGEAKRVWISIRGDDWREANLGDRPFHCTLHLRKASRWS